MKTYTRGRSFVARAGVLALVAGCMTAIAIGPAQADTTTGGGTAPVVSGTTSTFSITPDQDGSVAPLTFAATVGDVNTMLNLTTVRLCLTLTSVNDTTCATPDGLDTIAVIWTEATNTFAIDDGAGTLAVDATSTSGYSAGAVSQIMSFNLTYGEALREGAWTSVVLATDDDTLTNSVTDTTGNTVNWYANVDTNRASVTHGAIAAGASADALTQSSTIVANGTSDINYAVADFTDGGITISNVNGTAGTSPGNDQFAMDCSPDATPFSATNDVRVLVTPVVCEAGIATTGTPEGGQTSDTQSVRLFVGTEWTRDATPLYSGAVTVTVTNG